MGHFRVSNLRHFFMGLMGDLSRGRYSYVGDKSSYLLKQKANSAGKEGGDRVSLLDSAKRFFL